MQWDSHAYSTPPSSEGEGETEKGGDEHCWNTVTDWQQIPQQRQVRQTHAEKTRTRRTHTIDAHSHKHSTHTVDAQHKTHMQETHSRQHKTHTHTHTHTRAHSTHSRHAHSHNTRTQLTHTTGALAGTQHASHWAQGARPHEHNTHTGTRTTDTLRCTHDMLTHDIHAHDMAQRKRFAHTHTHTHTSPKRAWLVGCARYCMNDTPSPPLLPGGKSKNRRRSLDEDFIRPPTASEKRGRGGAALCVVLCRPYALGVGERHGARKRRGKGRCSR